MTKTEFRRLKAFHLASQNRPTMSKTLLGRRHAKGRAKAVGQVLKCSRVKPQIRIER